jgi:hypothetical protein
VELVALDLQPFRDTDWALFPLTLCSISSFQYETMDPYFVVKMMPLIPPVRGLA